MARAYSKEIIPDTLKRCLIESFFFEEKHFIYLLDVKILNLLKISIILAHNLCRIPKIWKEILLEKVIEYHGGRDFCLVEKSCHFF
jgi:hypothetical protein